MSEGETPSEETETGSADGEAAGQKQFAELPDGSGCIEIWEHLSEQRERDDSKACVNE